MRVPYDILTGPEIRERWPALNSPDDFTGLHDARGGYSEPEEYLVALARRVRELGVPEGPLFGKLLRVSKEPRS